MAGLFPSGKTNYTNPEHGSKTGIEVGGRTLDDFISDHNDDIEALIDKVGISHASPADAPVADRLLGSNENAKSGWIQLRAGMVPNGLIVPAMTTGIAPVTSVTALAQMNFVINPAFDVWVKGSGPFSSQWAVTADRWMNGADSGTPGTVTKDVITPLTGMPGFTNCLKLVTPATASTYYILQPFEDFAHFAYQPMTFSAWVLTSAANTARVVLDGGAGQKFVSSYHTGSGAWQRLSISATFGAVPNVSVYLQVEGASKTVWFAGPMLTYGLDVRPFSVLPRTLDVIRTQRYLEKHASPDTTGMLWRGYMTAGGGVAGFVPFNTEKGGVPSVTKQGTWGIGGLTGQPTFGGSYITWTGYSFEGTKDGSAGTWFVYQDSADDTIIAEWAP
jgi:hypothetical protein